MADVNRSIELASLANSIHPDFGIASTLTNGYIDRGETRQRTVGTQAGLDDYRAAMRTLEPWLDDPEAKAAAEKLKLGIESYIGSALAELGQLEEGVAYTMRAIDGTRDLVKSDPGNYSYRYDAVMLSSDLTSILQRLGRREDAFKYAQLMVDDSEELVRRDPENINYAHWLGVAYFSRGSALVDEGKTEEGLADFERSLARFEENVRIAPNYVESRDNLPPVLARTAITYRQVGRNEDAIAILRKSVDIAKANFDGSPSDVGLAVAYTSSLGQLGDLLATNGQAAEAIPIQELAIKTHGEKIERDPDNMQLQRNYATLHARIAQSYLWAGQRTKAETAALKAREIMSAIRASTFPKTSMAAASTQGRACALATSSAKPATARRRSSTRPKRSNASPHFLRTIRGTTVGIANSRSRTTHSAGRKSQQETPPAQSLLPPLHRHQCLDSGTLAEQCLVPVGSPRVAAGDHRGATSSRHARRCPHRINQGALAPSGVDRWARARRGDTAQDFRPAGTTRAHLRRDGSQGGGAHRVDGGAQWNLEARQRFQRSALPRSMGAIASPSGVRRRGKSADRASGANANSAQASARSHGPTRRPRARHGRKSRVGNRPLPQVESRGFRLQISPKELPEIPDTGLEPEGGPLAHFSHHSMKPASGTESLQKRRENGLFPFPLEARTGAFPFDYGADQDSPPHRPDL
jgi:hypothetical protein